MSGMELSCTMAWKEQYALVQSRGVGEAQHIAILVVSVELESESDAQNKPVLIRGAVIR